MKIFIPLLVSCCCFGAYAQKIVVTTKYYDNNNTTLPDASRAHYYRIDSIADGYYGAYSYYVSNKQLRHREAFLKSEVVRPEQWFYENGQLMMDLSCQNNFAIGDVIVWYADGNKLANLKFPDRAEKNESFHGRDLQILNYWDSVGAQLVTNGQGSANFKFPSPIAQGGNGPVVDGRRHGVWTGTMGDGTYEEHYDKGKLQNGVTTLNGKTYNYTEIEASALPKGGMITFYQYVSRNMKYPPKARRARAQGKVYVEFVVDKDGSLIDVKTLKGFHPLCDAEAERATRLAPSWSPGLQRGIPVKQRMVLPITFKIG